MDPIEYLTFSDLDLVNKSRNRRNGNCRLKRIEINSKINNSLNFTFSNNSEIIKFLIKKTKIGNCNVYFNGNVILGPHVHSAYLPFPPLCSIAPSLVR